MNDFQSYICSAVEAKSNTCMTDLLHWLIAFTNPFQTWEDEPTFLFIQFSVIFGAILNYVHAWNRGGRFLHFWWATIVVSLVTEWMCYLLPSINNFWHSQGIVSLFGRRFPLYIVLVYNQFWYTAWVTALRANLKWWAEPFAVGLLVVILDLPYDIMGIKMLWWTWHDTDVNIYDRHYHVPWTSYYFHSAFVAALIIVFFGSRKILMPAKSKFEVGNCFTECLCTVLAGSLAMPVGVSAFFLIFYHPMHDWFDIHSEVPVIMWLSLCLLISWISDRTPTTRDRSDCSKEKLQSLPVFNVAQHFLLFFLLMFVAKPEEVKATGLHQPIGPCNATEDTFSVTGVTLKREKYLCTENYNEPMSFHCLPEGKPPPSVSSWYTICGLPFENAMEYKLIIWFCCAMGLTIYMQLLLFSGNEVKLPVSSPMTKVESGTKKQKKKRPAKVHRD
ncbi:uncharacterized protein [Watersipora subatra]|uniref:uncharacterized protein n=1 Tax=Watersipora subatra TaxID=2589382 RepID=UPI00355B68F9